MTDELTKLRRKVYSKTNNDESVMKEVFEPALAVKALIDQLEKLDASKLGLSVFDILHLVEEVLYWAKSEFNSQPDMSSNPIINSEKIVGETGPDGVVESREQRKRQVLLPTKHFAKAIEDILMLIITIKQSRDYSAPVLLNRIEGMIVELFSSTSTLKEKILENYRSGSFPATTKDRLMPRLGHENRLKQQKAHLDSLLPSSVARDSVSNLIRRFGTSVVPLEQQSVIAKSFSQKTGKKDGSNKRNNNRRSNSRNKRKNKR